VNTFQIELLVHLIIPDSTATTAKHALHRLGMRALEEVRRYERWLFTFEGDSGEWPSLGERLCGVDVLVNANKHKATAALAPHGGDLGTLPVAQKSNHVIPQWIFVQSAHDPRANSVHRVLCERLDFATLRRSDRWDLWLLGVAGNDRAAARSVAERAVEKLLANPQFQTAKVFAPDGSFGSEAHG
jgi:phosphoribosylformylglycinamidine (FGAM) synthase PurS component